MRRSAAALIARPPPPSSSPPPEGLAAVRAAVAEVAQAVDCKFTAVRAAAKTLALAVAPQRRLMSHALVGSCPDLLIVADAARPPFSIGDPGDQGGSSSRVSVSRGMVGLKRGVPSLWGSRLSNAAFSCSMPTLRAAADRPGGLGDGSSPRAIQSGPCPGGRQQLSPRGPGPMLSGLAESCGWPGGT
jgi:hypothetical protein